MRVWTHTSAALSFVLIAALAACGPRADAPAGPEAPEVSAEPQPLDPASTEAGLEKLAGCGPASVDGFCGVRFGMSPDQAKAAFPTPLERYSGDAGAADDPNACFEFFAAPPVEGVTFLVEDAKVGRVDFLSAGVTTADGFGVGTPGDDIRAKYGAALSESPNKYEPEVAELTLSQGGGKIVFEIQDGRVRAWRAGVAPTIDYVERCS